MALAVLKSVDEKPQTSNLKTATTRCDQQLEMICKIRIPGRYVRYGYPGSYPDTDTTREGIEVALEVALLYMSNFNYPVGAVDWACTPTKGAN